MGGLIYQENVECESNRFCFSRASLVRPRRSFHRSSSSLASMSSRKSFSYDKLAQVPIQLTVVKSDGSSFEIYVKNSATIADLKLAVESVFSHLSRKGLDEISWQHVWGHFCLSYRGMKLLNDSENIKDYGIKDGDKLHFVRHVSIAYNVIKKRSTKPLDVLRSCTISETSEEQMQPVGEDEDEDDRESPECPQYETMTCGSVQTFRCQPHAIRRSRQFNWPRGRFIGYFRSLFHFCDKRAPSYSSRVSQVET